MKDSLKQSTNNFRNLTIAPTIWTVACHPSPPIAHDDLLSISDLAVGLALEAEAQPLVAHRCGLVISYSMHLWGWVRTRYTNLSQYRCTARLCQTISWIWILISTLIGPMVHRIFETCMVSFPDVAAIRWILSILALILWLKNNRIETTWFDLQLTQLEW